MRSSPGVCPICGEPHMACKPSNSSASIVIPQLPARDAMTATVRDVPPSAVMQPESFSTGTYRGKKKS